MYCKCCRNDPQQLHAMVERLEAEKAELVAALPSESDYDNPHYCMCDSCSITCELLAKYVKESKT